MDLEAAKKATVDSMEVAMEAKSDSCRWKWQIENAKETIIISLK
jgi:hypothetical protein